MLCSPRRVAGLAGALALVIASQSAAAEEPPAMGPSPVRATPPILAPEAPEVPSSGTTLLTAGLLMNVIGVGFLAGGAVGFAQDRCSACELGLPQGFSVGSMVVGGGLIVSGVVTAVVGAARRHAAHEDARVFVEPSARGFVVRF
jgi:hypothetical protein